jgi:hypothetical protein
MYPPCLACFYPFLVPPPLKDDLDVEKNADTQSEVEQGREARVARPSVRISPASASLFGLLRSPCIQHLTRFYACFWSLKRRDLLSTLLVLVDSCSPTRPHYAGRINALNRRAHRCGCHAYLRSGDCTGCRFVAGFMDGCVLLTLVQPELRGA